jgi:hypothetical protein
MVPDAITSVEIPLRDDGVKIGWHHLRACFNTLAPSAGADAVDRQILMRHMSDRMNAVNVMQAEEGLRRRGDLMLKVQGLIIRGYEGGSKMITAAQA